MTDLSVCMILERCSKLQKISLSSTDWVTGESWNKIDDNRIATVSCALPYEWHLSNPSLLPFVHQIPGISNSRHSPFNPNREAP